MWERRLLHFVMTSASYDSLRRVPAVLTVSFKRRAHKVGRREGRGCTRYRGRVAVPESQRTTTLDIELKPKKKINVKTPRIKNRFETTNPLVVIRQIKEWF